MRSLVGAHSVTAGAVLVAGVLYPVAVYIGMRKIAPGFLVGGLLALVALRAWRATGEERRASLLQLMVALVALGCVLGWPAGGFKAYPILLNLAFAASFTLSLVMPPSAVERMARLVEGQPAPEAVAYMRRVTLLWTVFFLLNAGISAWTALGASLEIWTLYNGFLAYVAVGLLFAGEYCVRLALRGRARRTA